MEILKELDIAVPTTHEEFLAACETLHQAGYTPIQGSIYTICYNLMRNDWGYQLATTEDPSVLTALENAKEFLCFVCQSNVMNCPCFQLTILSIPRFLRKKVKLISFHPIFSPHRVEYSKLDEGSTFVVTLPFKRDPNGAAAAAAAAPADPHDLHILLVEDSALNRKIAEFLLKDAGMNSHIAKPFETAKLLSAIAACVKKA